MRTCRKRVEVRRREDGVWWARVYLGTDRVTGKRIRRYRSWKADLSREEAQGLCDEWVSSFAPSLAAGASKRLDSMVASYIADPLNGFTENTVSTYGMALRCYIAPTIGDIPYDELEPHEVQAAYRELMVNRGISAKSLQVAHTLLKGAYSKWVPQLGRNLMDDVPSPVSEPSEPFALDEEQVATLVAALAPAMADGAVDLASARARTVATAAYLSLNTGLRCGEVCALRVCDWRRRFHDLHVCGTAVSKPKLHRQPFTKGKRAGNVPLAPEVEAVLEDLVAWQKGWLGDRALRDARRPVLPYGPGGEMMRPATLSTRFKTIAEGCGLPDETVFHTLRHSYATLLIAGGADVRTVQELMRHADVATTLRLYASVLPGRGAEEARKFARIHGTVPR